MSKERILSEFTAEEASDFQSGENVTVRKVFILTIG
jgi:hypothetical protein